MKNPFITILPRIHLWGGVLLFLAMTTAIHSFYWVQKENLKQELQTQLLGIGVLKVNQINAWVEQYYRDGLLLKNDTLFLHGLGQWMCSRNFPRDFPPRVSQNLLARKAVMNYRELFIVTPAGDLLFAPQGERHHTLDGASKQLVQQAGSSGEILFSPIHDLPGGDGDLHMEMVVPLVADAAGQPVASVALFVIDVEQFLFPMVQTWPFPSATAETLLVVREGDEAVFLNKLRHWPGPAMSLRLPIPPGESPTPAIRGLRGEQGIMEGVDYRGMPVLAATIPVARLPWVMVSKMDQEEAYAPLRFQSGAFLLVILVTLLLALVLLRLWWVNNAREVIRKTMDRLDLSQRIAQVGTWDWDPYPDQEIWSRELFHILGIEPCQIHGNRLVFQQHLHPEDRQRVIWELYRFLERDPLFEREYRILRDNGKERVILEKGSIFRDRHGKVTRVIGVVMDITERKLVEASLQAAKAYAEEANQAKDLFLANMSHEVRTPLNAIMNLSHLALHASPSPRQADYLNKIQNASQFLAMIIHDILDLSKIRLGKLELESVSFLLEDVLRNLSSILGATNMKRLKVLFQMVEPLPRHYQGDPLRLGQVLLNLLGNAIKFTDHGFVLLVVEAAEQGPERVALRFTIKDSGCGITAEQMQGIFQPFVQGDATISRRHGGAGLGLAISQSLVTLMNGTLTATSQPGQGSTFTLTVPLELLPDPWANDREPLPLAGRVALVVDELPLSRHILVTMLASLGVAARAVADGTAVRHELEAAQAGGQPVTLLFWSGEVDHDLFQGLRPSVPARGPCKCFLLHAGGVAEADALARALGMDAVLAHPFTPAMLRDAILMVLDHPAAGKEGASPPLAFAGERVLVVEDMEINQQIAQELLMGEGCAVTLARDGQEAITLAGRQPFDLVFMDLQMPGMDGLETTRRLRQLPGMATLPIVAMTAHAFAADREECLRGGMNDHLAKPINPRLLHEALRRWLPMAVTPATPPPTPAAGPSPLASLPGFDLAAGLANVIGNRLLYMILLKKFRQSNLATMTRVHEALAAGERARAKDLVHGVTGVAGNLGAQTLMLAARELEKELSSQADAGEGIALDKVTAFQRCLEETLTALQHLESGEETALKRENALEDPTAAHQVLETLTSLLTNKDVVEGMHWVEELRRHLAATPLVTATEQLMEQLFRFDFEQAQQTLETIRQALGDKP